jgi:hypothetical protein
MGSDVCRRLHAQLHQPKVKKTSTQPLHVESLLDELPISQLSGGEKCFKATRLMSLDSLSLLFLKACIHAIAGV